VVEADIAVACCRRSDDSTPDDLYPDRDAAPLRAALMTLGVTSRLVSWDDPGVEWAAFSKVFVSSTWDSVDRPAEYLAWARRVSEVSVLVNPVSILEWNLDKVHQRDLEVAGVAVIPTTWVGPGDAWGSPPASEFVVKPSVSAGGRNTARYAPGDPAGVAHIRRLQEAGQTVMVQEYLSAIDTEGETNLVFVEGAFSHAVHKKPVLRTGQGVVDRPWERMAWTGVVGPTARQLAVAEETMMVVSGLFDGSPLYGRVDVVDDGFGASLVLEVELIDPYLSLDMEPAGATRLAAALCRPL
jgi:hypothetical protein